MLPHSENEEQVGVPFPPDMHDARHLWLKAGLLCVWALVTFGACWFVRDLTWQFGQWQFGYWMAAQGAVLMFLLIIVVYCVAMDYFERQQARDEARKAAEAHDASSAASDLHA